MRFSDGMNGLQLIVAMSDGNPGATTVMALLAKEPGGVELIQMLDQMEVYGSKIWIIYSDLCKKSLESTKQRILLAALEPKLREELHADINKNL